MKQFLKSLVVAFVGFYSTQGSALNCNDLYSGKTVEDHFSSGRVKMLQTIESIQGEYGDSSPLPTLLLKKDSVKQKHLSQVSLEIYLTKNNKKELFNKYNKIELWADNNEYYAFVDYNVEKLNQSVFVVEGEGISSTTVVGASEMELQLKLDNKLVCKKKLHIDNH